MNARAILPMLSLLGATCTLAAPSAPVDQVPALIPHPVRANVTTGAPGFSLENGINVDAQTSSSPLGSAAVRALQAAGITIRTGAPQSDLTLRQARGIDPEWYALSVAPEGISITVDDPKALHLAAQTLAQAATKARDGKAALPAMDIEDQPLMAYRGLMVDVCRHFRTKDEMKQIIRLMARYKLNHLHWHLTDDQGWRVEIKQYPKLTEIGSHRPGTWDTVTRDHINTDKPESGFYTREDILDITAYARERGITIIPEIEVPGHSCALLAAYPELGNSDIPGYNPQVACTFGVHDYVLAPKPETFRFLSNLITEICDLFPDAPYIHIGGDEAPRTQWQQSPQAQAFMKQHNLTTEAGIQHYFTHFCLGELAKHQRRLIGWDEIQEDGGIDPSAIVMVWRGIQPAYSALKAGHSVILTPLPWFYFDYGQGKYPKDPGYKPITEHWDCDWRFVYDFDPSLADLTPEQQARILGVQGNLWSEYLPTYSKFQYMLVPRLCALAEVAWLPKAQRNAEDFKQRLHGQYDYLDSEHINFREDDGTPRRDREAMTRDTPPGS